MGKKEEEEGEEEDKRPFPPLNNRGGGGKEEEKRRFISFPQALPTWCLRCCYALSCGPLGPDSAFAAELFLALPCKFLSTSTKEVLSL